MVEWKEGMNVDTLKEAITVKRNLRHFPAIHIKSIYSESSAEDMFKQLSLILCMERLAHPTNFLIIIPSPKLLVNSVIATNLQCI